MSQMDDYLVKDHLKTKAKQPQNRKIHRTWVDRQGNPKDLSVFALPLFVFLISVSPSIQHGSSYFCVIKS